MGKPEIGPRLVVAAAPTPLEAAFREHARYVATIAHRLLGRADEVDDVVQDVFLAATRGLDHLREPGALRGWLATITVRVSLARLRRRRLLKIFGLDDAPTYADVVDPGASPVERVAISRVYAALDRMPARDRIAWTLRCVEGESLARVAELSQCSLATAKRRIATVQARLREVTDG